MLEYVFLLQDAAAFHALRTNAMIIVELRTSTESLKYMKSAVSNVQAKYWTGV